MQTKRLTLCAILTALSMGLSFFEVVVPISLVVPIPGIKLGLSSIVIMFACMALDYEAAFFILIIKIFLVSLLMGSVTSFLFSLTGGIYSYFVLCALIPFRDKWVSLYGISIASSAAHNIGQITAACIALKSIDVILYLPVLLVISIPTGVITAFITEQILQYNIKKQLKLK